eukprot:1418209-Pyramimonas_sp.AAC.1
MHGDCSHSEGPYFGMRGVAAADSFATALVRVCAIPSMDSTGESVCGSLSIFIDDCRIQSTGTTAH